MNKRFLITSLVSVALAFAGYAEEKTHVVERGETLTTIAKTYGVTEQALVKANPDAASFCYVGMVLTIPESANAEARSSESGDTNAQPDSDSEKLSYMTPQNLILTRVTRLQDRTRELKLPTKRVLKASAGCRLRMMQAMIPLNTGSMA